MLESRMIGAVVALLGQSIASAALVENWDSTSGSVPASAPTAGTPYTITTSGANGMGTWTGQASDTGASTGGYFVAGPTSITGGAGGSGQVAAQSETNRDSTSASLYLESPAFTLSNAASGSMTIQYIGGSVASNVPTSLSSLGTTTNGGSTGFMGLVLVDPSGTVVGSAADGNPGQAGVRTLTLNYTGLNPATAYNLVLVDNGTRGGTWGWNGIDTVTIPFGTLAPEPASLGLLGLGAIGVLARRRKA